MVLLLDLVAQRDGFIADEGMLRLAARLEQAGVAARVVRAVGVSPGDAAVAAQLAAGPAPRLVALARAWSDELLRWLRALLPAGATLVRLTRDGTPSALDARFDAVVDFDGLLELAAGRVPAQARFRAALTADLRRNLTEAALPAPAAGDGLRPTIQGPATGCPWLADAQKSPHFAGVQGEGVQFKGCTFCLDQTGAYAAPTQAQVLSSWLGQLRALRARSPSVREVLLVDERPHPFLPAFFEALAGEPALHGVELLIKSRVDWLLELGESHLARAAAAAATSGSVLHVYLVGFENFDAFHLELFNKGQTPEDSEAAIALLRSLSARFPESFEFRRLRAHGLVLFTPWTTPDALLENARWMARVGFSELRADALRTRLRLYPRTPLYHLAERDGLLTERFEEGRPDRALEQGYDASAPWRFRDPRTEAVFRVASALDASRTLDEADVLRCAAELLIAHPGLAEVAGDAHLPVVMALRPWRGAARLRGLGALGVDLELAAVFAGRKAAALKENVPIAEAQGLARAYRAMGLHAEVASTHRYDADAGVHREGAEHAIVAVAATAAALAQVLELQRALSTQRRRGDVEALGRAMGYPACCAAAFAEQLERGDNADNERQTLLREPDAPLSPLLNRLGPFPLVSHHVCSAGCAPSVALAREALEVLRQRSPEAARVVEEAQARPVLFLDYRRVAGLEGRFEGDDFVLEGVDGEGARVLSLPRSEPSAQPAEPARHGASPLDAAHAGRARGDDARGRSAQATAAAAAGARLRLSRDGVRVTLPDGRQHFIAAARPVLVVPGAPLAPVVRRAIEAPAAPVPRLEQGLALPRLPGVIRPTVRVESYRLSRVNREGEAWVLVLTGVADEFGVRLTARTPGDGAPAAGPFSFDFGPMESLTAERRAALTLLARVIADASARNPETP